MDFISDKTSFWFMYHANLFVYTIQSIFDGIDLHNAIGDFHFAKMNLENHNETIPQTPLDDVCYSILKQRQKRHRFDKKTYVHA